MDTLKKITQDLKSWESEYTNAKKDYNNFVKEYEASHPNFANQLKKAWKETNEQFWGIEVKFRKSFKKASQQKEPQKSLDRYQARLLKKLSRSKAIKKFESIKEELLKEAVMRDKPSSEVHEKFRLIKKRYKRAKKQKANLSKSLKGFLNSKIFKDQKLADTSDYQLIF